MAQKLLKNLPLKELLNQYKGQQPENTILIGDDEMRYRDCVNGWMYLKRVTPGTVVPRGYHRVEILYQDQVDCRGLLKEMFWEVKLLW